MKLSDAKNIIDNAPRLAGYRVSFEIKDGGVLRSDYFPDKDETALKTEDEAWEWAARFAFAGKNKNIVNVYVISANDFNPAPGYEKRKLNIFP